MISLVPLLFHSVICYSHIVPLVLFQSHAPHFNIT